MRCGRDAWAAAAFAALADVLGRFPTLAQSCPLVLVPGPHDLGLSDVLPRPPLPEAVLQPLQKRVSRLVLGSNPCRYEGRVRERSARSHPARTPWTLTLGFRLKTTVVLAGSPPLLRGDRRSGSVFAPRRLCSFARTWSASCAATAFCRHRRRSPSRDRYALTHTRAHADRPAADGMLKRLPTKLFATQTRIASVGMAFSFSTAGGAHDRRQHAFEPASAARAAHLLVLGPYASAVSAAVGGARCAALGGSGGAFLILSYAVPRASRRSLRR